MGVLANKGWSDFVAAESDWHRSAVCLSELELVLFSGAATQTSAGPYQLAISLSREVLAGEIRRERVSLIAAPAFAALFSSQPIAQVPFYGRTPTNKNVRERPTQYKLFQCTEAKKGGR